MQVDGCSRRKLEEEERLDRERNQRQVPCSGLPNEADRTELMGYHHKEVVPRSKSSGSENGRAVD